MSCSSTLLVLCCLRFCGLLPSLWQGAAEGPGDALEEESCNVVASIGVFWDDTPRMSWPILRQMSLCLFSPCRGYRRFHGSLLASCRFVGHFKSRKEREAEFGARAMEFTNVYIKNFGDDMDDNRLREIFSRFGECGC